MKHKPYTMEWNRQRYLSEALSKYFEDGENVNVILEDITDILSGWLHEHQSKVDDIQTILKTLKE